MAEQENLWIVRDAYAAFARGDIAAVLNSMADDVVWEMPGPSQIPAAGTFRGKQGASEFFRTLSESEEMEAMEPQRFFADGDMVLVLGRYAARVKATGNHAESQWVHAFTLRDGKVSKFYQYFDTAAYAQAYEPAATLT